MRKIPRFARLAIVSVVTALLAGLSTSSVSNATHSVPSPRWFYDKDNDGIAEATDADFYFQAAGSYWDIKKLDRLDDAVLRWRSNTDVIGLRHLLGRHGAADRRLPLRLPQAISP